MTTKRHLYGSPHQWMKNRLSPICFLTFCMLKAGAANGFQKSITVAEYLESAPADYCHRVSRSFALSAKIKPIGSKNLLLCSAAAYCQWNKNLYLGVHSPWYNFSSFRATGSALPVQRLYFISWHKKHASGEALAYFVHRAGQGIFHIGLGGTINFKRFFTPLGDLAYQVQFTRRQNRWSSVCRLQLRWGSHSNAIQRIGPPRTNFMDLCLLDLSPSSTPLDASSTHSTPLDASSSDSISCSLEPTDAVAPLSQALSGSYAPDEFISIAPHFIGDLDGSSDEKRAELTLSFQKKHEDLEKFLENNVKDSAATQNILCLCSKRGYFYKELEDALRGARERSDPSDIPPLKQLQRLSDTTLLEWEQYFQMLAKLPTDQAQGFRDTCLHYLENAQAIHTVIKDSEMTSSLLPLLVKERYYRPQKARMLAPNERRESHALTQEKLVLKHGLEGEQKKSYEVFIRLVGEEAQLLMQLETPLLPTMHQRFVEKIYKLSGYNKKFLKMTDSLISTQAIPIDPLYTGINNLESVETTLEIAILKTLPIEKLPPFMELLKKRDQVEWELVWDAYCPDWLSLSPSASFSDLPFGQHQNLMFALTRSAASGMLPPRLNSLSSEEKKHPLLGVSLSDLTELEKISMHPGSECLDLFSPRRQKRTAAHLPPKNPAASSNQQKTERPSSRERRPKEKSSARSSTKQAKDNQNPLQRSTSHRSALNPTATPIASTENSSSTVSISLPSCSPKPKKESILPRSILKNKTSTPYSPSTSDQEEKVAHASPSLSSSYTASNLQKLKTTREPIPLLENDDSVTNLSQYTPENRQHDQVYWARLRTFIEETSPKKEENLRFMLPRNRRSRSNAPTLRSSKKKELELQKEQKPTLATLARKPLNKDQERASRQTPSKEQTTSSQVAKKSETPPVLGRHFTDVTPDETQPIQKPCFPSMENVYTQLAAANAPPLSSSETPSSAHAPTSSEEKILGKIEGIHPTSSSSSQLVRGITERQGRNHRSSGYGHASRSLPPAERSNTRQTVPALFPPHFALSPFPPRSPSKETHAKLTQTGGTTSPRVFAGQIINASTLSFAYHAPAIAMRTPSPTPTRSPPPPLSRPASTVFNEYAMNHGGVANARPFIGGPTLSAVSYAAQGQSFMPGGSSFSASSLTRRFSGLGPDGSPTPMGVLSSSPIAALAPRTVPRLNSVTELVAASTTSVSNGPFSSLTQRVDNRSSAISPLAGSRAGHPPSYSVRSLGENPSTISIQNFNVFYSKPKEHFPRPSQ